jgi:hypothetical protein
MLVDMVMLLKQAFGFCKKQNNALKQKSFLVHGTARTSLHRSKHHLLVNASQFS